MAKNEIQTVAMRVSGGNLPTGYSITLNIQMDFSGCTRDEIVAWALAERKVALQRVLRSKSPEFLQQLADDGGLQVHARDAGRNIKTRDERVTELTESGVPRNVAEVLVDNPEKLSQLLNES